MAVSLQTLSGSPCSVAPYSVQPWCNISIFLNERIADLVARIPDGSKPAMLQNSDAGGGPLQPYQWWSEGLHGVAISPGVNFTGTTPFATSYPQVILTAASFNVSLYEAIGDAISTEARVMNNQGHAGETYWTPNINIFRDPRWGRGHETPGEDPFLSSEYAAHFINGFQKGTSQGPQDPRYLKASACAKHFTAYDLELWNGTDRFHFDALVSQQDLADTINVPFQAAVERADVSCVMCSYNAVNGVPSCADETLLTGLLKETWGFDGYLTSDCGAITSIQDDHHYTNTTDDTCAVVAQSGLTIGCDIFLRDYLQKALDDKAVTQTQVDSMLSQNQRTRFRLGDFDNVPQPYRQLGLDSWCTEESNALSLFAARSGITLLKNEGGVLPIKAEGVSSVAVIGPNANATTELLGNYFGIPCKPVVSVIDGVSDYFSSLGRNDVNVTFVQGTGISDGNSAGFSQAFQAAASADVTILVLGLDSTQEAEGLDRTIISLPGAQLQLMQGVAQAAKGPVILVCINGGGIDISAAAAPKSGVDGILWAGYPGPYGGQAVAETIFVASESGNGVVPALNTPAGRLVSSWYPATFVDAVSMFDMSFRPANSSLWPPYKDLPGRTYRFYAGNEPLVFPFGYGESYTTWSYSPSMPSRQSLQVAEISEYLASSRSPLYPTMRASVAEQQGAAVTYAVNVTNTGRTFDSDVVVMGFVIPPGAGTNGVPLKELFGFQRVHVPVGATKTVYLGLQHRFLTQVITTARRESEAGDNDIARVPWPGRYRVVFGVGEKEETEAAGFDVVA